MIIKKLLNIDGTSSEGLTANSDYWIIIEAECNLIPKKDHTPHRTIQNHL